MNQPLSFDFHGDLDLEAPIEGFRPDEIDIYLDLDTYVGKETCEQTCHHCWFVNNRQVMQRRFDPTEGLAVVNALKSTGYRVFPRYTDSFAYRAELMRVYSKANARTYHSSEKVDPESVLEYGEAWTSGKPLLSEEGTRMLDLARDNHYRTITITFHGLIADNNELLPQSQYPINGVLPAAEFEQVVELIHSYNAKRQTAEFPGFQIGVGVTLGKHNSSQLMLKRYMSYFNAKGITRLRFNNFFDHGKRHPHLVLTEAEVTTAYQNIKSIHETMPLNFQLGVSEDLGTIGIGVLGLPKSAGYCRAGRQLFGIIPSKNRKKVLDHSHASETVGEVVGCVNVFEPILGELVKRTCRASGEVDYIVSLFPEEISALQTKRMDGTYKNGCFAREIVDEIENSAKCSVG